MPQEDRPQAVVIAGPNGAGKTTAAPDLLRDGVGIDAFVNADVIAAGLSAFDPQAAAFEAGRIMLRRLDELVAGRQDFAFESTLSGRTVCTRLVRLHESGYAAHVLYLWLPSSNLAVSRVRLRVAAGGHDVPEVVIRRRFRRSLVQFDRIVRPLATTWAVYDGSDAMERPLVARGAAGGRIEVVDADLWARIRAQVEEEA